jgi:hypothetical protein
LYVDDGIFISQAQEGIDEAIKDLQSRKFDIEDHYFGVNVEQLPDGCITLSQPHRIEDIIHDKNHHDRQKNIHQQHQLNSYTVTQPLHHLIICSIIVL